MPAGSGLKERYDILVIGGGVHGAAVALEAAALGHEVLLVDKQDFCSGVSANSLRIIHGGLRYLQTADLKRSRESAREQAELLRYAPHLVRPLPCLMGTEPSFTRSRPAVSLGLWLYDHIVRAGLGPRRRGRVLALEEAVKAAGFDAFEDCTGAAEWWDAQVVDSERLVLTYLLTAGRAGADIRNYLAVEGIDPEGDSAVARLRDIFTGRDYIVRAGVVIDTASLLAPHEAWTRAVNLVIDRPGGAAAVGRRLPNKVLDSERLFFATPLDRRVILGTWYFPDRHDDRDTLTSDEFHQCLEDARQFYAGTPVAENDVSLVHLGRLPVRDAADPLSLLDKPVIKAVNGNKRLVSVTGTKYTTARPTAIKALRAAGLNARPASHQLAPWYGADYGPVEGSMHALRARLEPHLDAARLEPLVQRLISQYGAVADQVVRRAEASANGFEMIPGVNAMRAELDYCIDYEHCQTVADFICRRSGLGALGPIPDSAINYCVAAMAEQFEWPDARVEAERAQLIGHYQRVQAPAEPPLNRDAGSVR